jgi:preprotein translocase SecE subunit
MIRSLSVLLAVLLAMTLSFSVLAEESATDESAVSTEESAEASTEASAEESTEASKEESKEESKAETSKPESNTTGSTATEESNFPWARVITLIVIVVLVLIVWVLTKTNTALGQRLKKFFKEYASEIKKVSWSTPKETLKATGVVLVFVIGAALAIGVLDGVFGLIVKKLAEIFN